jgi:hypothetical protein
MTHDFNPTLVNKLRADKLLQRHYQSDITDQELANIKVMIPVSTSVRLATTQDHPFILDSWAKELSHTFPFKYHTDYYHFILPTLSKLLQQSTIAIAYLNNEPEEIVSYLIYTCFLHRQVIHFAYTKNEARHQGKLTQLLNFSNPTALPMVLTHPAKSDNRMKRLTQRCIFDPSILETL